MSDRTIARQEVVPLGALDPLKLAPVPAFLGMFAYIGPAFIWTGLAQGSGELIWWPYLTAKYGDAFLGLMIPASLLQFWVNLEIVRYTATTGETILTGFSRIGPWFSTLMAIGLMLENTWFGAYASAGGTALAELTGFPPGWSARGQSLFWGYLTITVYFFALLFGRVVYRVIEKFSYLIVAITVGGVTFAIFQPKVFAVGGDFFSALLTPNFYKPTNWDPEDLKVLLTSLAFAGSGGFGNFFFSYWIRDKGIGMAKYIGRVTSPITGEPETIPSTGYAFADTPENRRNYKGFMRSLALENSIAISLNLLTTALMCWLAWALLMPEGKVPRGWQIAVVQSAFFEVAWGPLGKMVFLIVAAAFLCDNWMQITDGSARAQADYIFSNFSWARRRHFRFWYYLFVCIFTLLSVVTMPLAEPGALIVFRGTIAFLAMGFYCPALIYLNYHLLPKAFPHWVKPRLITRILMWIVSGIYLGISIWYLVVVFR